MSLHPPARSPRSTPLTASVAALALSLACTGISGCSAEPDAAPATEPEPVVLAPAPFQRLTAPQLRNTLVDLLGPLPRTELQPDENPYLFTTIGAASTPYSELGVDRVESTITLATEQVFSDPVRREALVGCAPVEPGDACVRGFVARFGRRAWRRPLTPTELERWTWVATDLAEGDAWRGLESAVAGLLQSPHSLYRVEVGVPAAVDDDAHNPERRRLTGYEVAARLSYLVWNTTPDTALLDAAEAGELDTAEGIERHARRMLADPRARDATRNFFDQYLDLGRLDHAAPDPQAFPGFTDTLRQAMRTEVHLIVDDLVHRRDTDVRQLFTTRRTFVNPELAAHYGLPVPDVSDVTYVPVDLPPQTQRAGILSLGAFLTMNAHPIETSPTLRGKFVMQRVLCQLVPAPPDDVNLDLRPDGQEPRTLRERLEQHREDPDCRGCHQLIDPPGFLFEHFDPVGRWRDTDAGHPVDASGDLSGRPLDGTLDLADALAQDERVGTCMTRQLFRHAHGRVDAESDTATLDQLHAAFRDADFRFQELVVALVTHRSFREVAPPVMQEVTE